jgi:fluoride exporter
MNDRAAALPWLGVLALVAVGGVVGATGRHLISEALSGGTLPWGTLVANVVGSAALGATVQVASRSAREPWWYPLLGVGVIGALTTMSSFQVELVLLIDDGRVLAAVVYLAATLVLGIGAGWAGLTVARRETGAA